MPLSGKVAVVLGGTGGIGFATCHLFASAGARVAVVARENREASLDVARMLKGSEHFSYACAIDNSTEIEALAESIQRDMGGADILINAAGMTRNIPHEDLHALDDATFDNILRVNTRAPFALIRSFAPLLRKCGDGLFVNISSIAASNGIGSCVAYCAAKAGLDVMGMALARALAPAIRVLTVSPGLVDTDFVPGRDRQLRKELGKSVPLNRLCTPEEVAEAVLACATLLKYSTGSVIQVDGGRHL